MTFFLGKREPTSDERDLRYSAIRPDIQLPDAPPPSGGYGRDFGDTGWLMLGNGPDDTVFAGFPGCGDCAWAGPAHEVMESCYNAKRAVPAFSGMTIVRQYSAYAGYDPQTGANDKGSYVRDVFKWRQKTGLVDDAGVAHKIGPYVALDPGNVDHLWEALWLFEAVGVGIQLPTSAMDQTTANQPWSVVPGTTIEGGHYVPLVGHPVEDVWTCVTWGQRQTMSSEFLSKYCDEAWAWIDPERYQQVTGETLQGFHDADLEKYLTLVAQRQNG